MLLILFWMTFLMFYFSYLFSVLFLGMLVLILMLCGMASVMYVKYLVVLVYISGVVIFILYISCLCWYVSESFSKWFLFLGIFSISLVDSGVWSKISDVGEYLWMYLFFSFLFNSLVMGYSYHLFKSAGSLRF